MAIISSDGTSADKLSGVISIHLDSWTRNVIYDLIWEHQLDLFTYCLSFDKTLGLKDFKYQFPLTSLVVI